MAGTGNRILVIEHDADLAYLIARILEDEGYAAEWTLESAQLLDDVRTRGADLLLLDLLPHESEAAFRLLDELRADPATARIPIVALTTSRPLADAAKASYNVLVAVTKPFDVEELLGAVHVALSEPPLNALMPPDLRPPSDMLAWAERILAQHSREALLRWVQRLHQQPPWQGRTDLHLGDVLNNIPILVETLNLVLMYGNPEGLFEQHPQAADRAKMHAAVRQQQGISLDALVMEYASLRNELWVTLLRYLPEPHDNAKLLELIQAVDGTLDRIIQITIPAYGEAQRREAA